MIISCYLTGLCCRDFHVCLDTYDFFLLFVMPNNLLCICKLMIVYMYHQEDDIKLDLLFLFHHFSMSYILPSTLEIVYGLS